jgi:hypothetical protein
MGLIPGRFLRKRIKFRYGLHRKVQGGYSMLYLERRRNS